MPLRFAVLFLALMLLYPQAALSAARSAFALWQQTVAPSLLPFFALIPALTSPEATACFGHLLRLPCRLLGIPEAAAGAVGIALAAGSPAGARALACIAAAESLPSGGALRAALMCGGVSPGFIVSGVGAGMLGDPSLGTLLLAAQILSLLSTSLLLRILLPQNMRLPPAADAAAASVPPIRFALSGVASILVWMVIFSVGTSIAGEICPAAAPIFALSAEFSTACAWAAQQNLPLWAFGMVIGFGGVCVFCQNMAVLKTVGIPPGMFFAGKCIHAVLCGAFTLLLGCVRMPALSFAPQWVLPFLCIACVLPLRRKIANPALK